MDLSANHLPHNNEVYGILVVVVYFLILEGFKEVWPLVEVQFWEKSVA